MFGGTECTLLFYINQWFKNGFIIESTFLTGRIVDGGVEGTKEKFT